MPKRKAAATWAAGTASAPSAPPPSDHASAAFGLAAPPPSPGQPQAAPLPQLTELQAAPPQPQLPQAPLPQAPLPGGLLLGPAQARAAPPQPQLPQALLPQVLPTASLGWQQLPAQPAGLLAHLPGVPLVSAPAPAPGLPTLMSRAESSAVSRLVEQIEQIEPKLSAATQSQLDAIAQQVVAALVAAGGRQLHAPGLRVQQKQYLGHLADQLQMARRDLLQAGRRLTLVQARDLVYAYLLRQLEQERRHLPDDQRLTLQQFFQQAQQAQTAQQAQQTQQERRLTDEQRLTLQQFFQQAQQAHQAQQAQQAQQAATAQALLEQLQLAAALQALFKHRTPVPLLSSSRQTTCPPCTLDGFVSEFGSASAAGPAAMADYVLSHLELAAPFIPVARAVLTFAFSQPGGLVRVGLYRRDTEADRWAGAALAWGADSEGAAGANWYCCESMGGMGRRQFCAEVTESHRSTAHTTHLLHLLQPCPLPPRLSTAAGRSPKR